MDNRYHRYAEQLDELKHLNRHRQFKTITRHGEYIEFQHRHMLNLSSNDYLGVNQHHELAQQFLQHYADEPAFLSSSSSRLLTGHFAETEQLEDSLNRAFGRQSLVFNSGYHMNIGILPALTAADSLIISDELIHASIIDGIRLSKAQRQRFAHQDFVALEQLLIAAQQREDIRQIFVVTESLFSMDGDMTDLQALVALRNRYPKVLLYVDDAHGVGVYGERGLGCAEQQNVIAQIDILVGTFGKALASQGGYVICDEVIRDYLINTVRPLIFSTALPPLNLAWTQFVFEYMQGQSTARQHLAALSQQLIAAIHARGLQCPSQSHIVPVIYGENAHTVAKAEQMQQQGYFVLPIRPPTVAPGTSRVRICLHAGLRYEQLIPLIACL